MPSRVSAMSFVSFRFERMIARKSGHSVVFGTYFLLLGSELLYLGSGVPYLNTFFGTCSPHHYEKSLYFFLPCYFKVQLRQSPKP